ncbi:hypothetical protein BIV57_19670 [Mangrovactinospora gilvigrisea]|uniref:DUF5107 domain-containing protein n=1 Tax=Mangrovactinospora gilvigrisea TaxID=1428644 RepID=A0A1J7BAR7_9ACTN|nr:DUF5107 domain-containing protein [Mangrovactinospora gilvigrisea]OIV35791.1 hypothetical protein BIV57_19670 [Mangrovactinospora gilvigrisea]
MSTRARLEPADLTLPTAAVGPLDPLPRLRPELDQPYLLDPDSVPAGVRENAERGAVRSIHPYLLQDGYGRDRSPADHPALVLDNGLLRAVFLPGLGGRLWSLTDLRTGTELLYRNPVVQPANLALRNAWLAGGVEWNLGTRGHAPTTCSPLFAAEATAPDGGPAVRMWEYERLRGLVFRIDAWLPEPGAETGGGPALKVRVEVRNPARRPAPLYWWSNIAVPETPDTRVLAPGERAFATGYEGRIGAVPVAAAEDGRDWTYPGRSEYAGDWFFDIPEGTPRPWEAAVEADGTGLLHSSTARLRGRKLFAWGVNAGGRRWAEWLTERGNGPYAEIQGGVAQTQFEHLELPAGAAWRWIETYQPLAADPALTHGADLDAARGAVASALPRAEADAEAACFDAAPARLLHTGSGWGALAGVSTAAAPFPEESLGAEQRPWRELRATGALPDGDGTAAPVSYVTGEEWDGLLAAAPQSWLTHYHRGVLAHTAGRLDAADAHYAASLAERATPWARRGRALLLAERGLLAEAAEEARAAASGAPGLWQLAAEALGLLLEAGLPAAALELVDTLPTEVRERGRVRMLTARAAVEAGELARARKLLEEGFEVPDLREGEVALSRLWTAAFPGEPVPERYDFRMSAG